MVDVIWTPDKNLEALQIGGGVRVVPGRLAMGFHAEAFVSFRILHVVAASSGFGGKRPNEWRDIGRIDGAFIEISWIARGEAGSVPDREGCRPSDAEVVGNAPGEGRLFADNGEKETGAREGEEPHDDCNDGEKANGCSQLSFARFFRHRRSLRTFLYDMRG
jgi:hypothetical protein